MLKQQRIVSSGTNEVVKLDTISSLVRENLCTGCGMCATICPNNALIMQFNNNGQLIPVAMGECKSCNLCNEICPQLFSNIANIKDSLHSSYEDILGRAEELTTWAGYARDTGCRMSSSSGGMLTLILSYLLRSHEIDAAIVVGPAKPKQGPLFKARIVRSTEELAACAGSKYYPIDLSQAISKLKTTNERVAIVGLPCHISGIRSMMVSSSTLQRQIRYLFGLVCGHGVSAYFTDFLLSVSGTSYNSIDRVSYREKQGTNKSADFTFCVYKDSALLKAPMKFTNSPYGLAWVRRLFVPYACDFCTDVFAEGADASFMDAWLPEYIKDPCGTSFIVSRRREIREVIQRLANKGVGNVWKIEPSDVIKSQAGVIYYKRELLPSRIYSALSRGKPVPGRLADLAIKGDPFQRKENNRYERYRRTANMFWQLHLPPRVKIGLILFFTGPGIIQRGRLLLLKMIGPKGKALIKNVFTHMGLFKKVEG